MGGEAQILKRIPRIRFPQRRPDSSNSGSISQSQHEISVNNMGHFIFSSSDVPAPPKNTAVGGRATLQPKRTLVSDKEIEVLECCAGRSLLKARTLMDGIGIHFVNETVNPTD